MHELVNNLPHIAAIGDSITSDFYVSSLPSMFFKMWGEKKGNWFIETDKSKSVNSIFERIDREIPIVAVQHSTPGSRMNKGPRTIIDRLINRKNMVDQVDEVISSKVFPDVFLVWTGHSAYDWVSHLTSEENLDKQFDKLTTKFRKCFENQLYRLYNAASEEDKDIVIIVFGFINIRPLFKLKERINITRSRNSSLFPYFDKAYEVFKSLHPKYQKRTIILSDKMNSELKKIVEVYRKKNNSRVRVVYSDVFSKGKTNSIGFVSSSDAWHPSLQGQKELARSAFRSPQEPCPSLVDR